MLDYLIAIMDKFGMYIHIVVNVLIICSGLGVFVKKFLYVMVEESLMDHIDVFVKMDNSGMVLDALIQVVLEDKSGMEPNVSALQIETSMEQSAYNVSMDKSGIVN